MVWPQPDTWKVPGRAEEAERLWRKGRSALQIAIELGFDKLGFSDRGRNVVIGKLNRMGLIRSRPTAVNHANNARPRPRPKRPWSKQDVVEQYRKPPSSTELPVAPTEPASLNLTLWEVTDNQCHWPCDTPAGVRYCGHPGRMWCAYHARRRAA